MDYFAPPVERLIEEFARLPGIGQKIHKFECFLAKAANSIRAGQAGHRHQDSTFTHGFTFLTFHILTGNLLILIIT